MTSRELVKATLEFKNTSHRAPRDLWTLPWSAIHYKDELDALIAKYNWDIGYPFPTIKETSPVESGNPYVIGEYIDGWGCKFTNIHEGIVGEVKDPIVKDEDWLDAENVHIPEHELAFDIEEVNRICAESDKYMLSAACPRPFEQLQFIRGTEQLYMDLIIRPDGMMEFIEKMHDFYCRQLTKWAKTDVDALRIMDDWGSQKSLLINPVHWREIFKPMYKDYIDIAHSHGKKMFMHSDGYILEILPDLVEMGLDAINSQIFCMGPENLRPFKGKITFWGEICRQKIIPEGTVDDIRAAVKAVYDNLWDNGGCIAQCEFGPGAKPENVNAIYEAWDKLTSPDAK